MPKVQLILNEHGTKPSQAQLREYLMELSFLMKGLLSIKEHYNILNEWDTSVRHAEKFSESHEQGAG